MTSNEVETRPVVSDERGPLDSHIGRAQEQRAQSTKRVLVGELQALAEVLGGQRQLEQMVRP